MLSSGANFLRISQLPKKEVAGTIKWGYLTWALVAKTMVQKIFWLDASLREGLPCQVSGGHPALTANTWVSQFATLQYLYLCKPIKIPDMSTNIPKLVPITVVTEVLQIYTDRAI